MTRVAIIGMGCRFAEAPDLQAYWQLMLAGEHAFGPIPEDRWAADVFYSESRRAADKTYAPAGAFIRDIRSFPALALGIPPRRVEAMDPQQRFALEVALQAVEDAGLTPADLPPRTGVYIGVTASEWREFMTIRQLAQSMAAGRFGKAPEDPSVITDAVSRVIPPRPYSAPGVLGNMCAATVAQELNLKGPAYTLDSACASGLVALSNAVTQLQTGSIDAALVGGVYLCLTPDHHVAFARIGAMSQAGVCRPFDARADGFVQGDGAGVVLVKRLEDAQRDGDRIYAVIEGMALNSDGAGDGPMAPNRVGQGDVIERAWRSAGLSAEGLGYIETHGTGTPVGDPTEVAGLNDILGAETRRAALGSSKANVGHTMSAAGIAGLIRATLALYHQTLPPMANFESPRSDLGLETTPFFIPKEAEPWRGPGRLAALSSFGFGGTNAHAVLSAVTETVAAQASQAELILLSAPDAGALAGLAGRTRQAVETDPTLSLAAVARAWNQRPPQAFRAALVASSREELCRHLAAIAKGELPEHCHLGEAIENPRVAFMFPGQGAQRPGMLRGIGRRFPSVARRLQRLSVELGGVLDRTLLELIYPDLRDDPVSDAEARDELKATSNCQPALLACGVALAELLGELGVVPSLTMGHSLGEFTAASVAGVVDPKEAMRFVAERGLAMERLGGDPGAMVALRTDEATAERLLAPGTIVANINHPTQVVVSGASDAITAVNAAAQEAGVDAIPLEVSHGFHSPVLRDLDVSGLVNTMSLRDGIVPFISAIDATRVTGADHARDIFTRHALAPVRFSEALNAADEEGADIYLQVAAGGPLASFARGTFRGAPKTVISLTSMDDDDGGVALLSSLGRLFVAGVKLDLSSILATAKAASLPPTVLPREDYWCVKDDSQRAPQFTKPATGSAPPTPSSAEAVPEPPPPAPSQAPLVRTVMRIIAEVSAYPLDSLKPTMTLMDTLGFDSLMVADLAAGLSAAFPRVAGLPQELLVNNPSVNDIIDFVQTTVDDLSAGEEEKGPFSAYEGSWRAFPLPQGATLSAYNGSRVLVMGGPSELRTALSARFTAASATVQTLPLGALPTNGPIDRVCVLVGDAPAEDAAKLLLATLTSQAQSKNFPHVMLLGAADAPGFEALAGVVRSLAHEWKHARMKACRYTHALTPDEVARRAWLEWDSADTTLDVRWDSAGRSVPMYSPVAWVRDAPLRDSDTVLITGGTRGIGLKLAQRLLPSGAAIILLGRGRATEPLRRLCRAHPDQIRHVLGDVTSLDSLESALAELPPVTVLVHAAGILADGELAEADAARGDLARSIKGGGLERARTACGPSLRLVLAMGSLAGRFGSRHQTHYAAANADLAWRIQSMDASAPLPRALCLEFGPWAESDMVATIPDAVQAQMRMDGVDFIDDSEGLDCLMSALESSQARGVLVLSRLRPRVVHVETRHSLNTDSHPYLLDHAIEGRPVFPLAAAADLLARTARVETPFALKDLRLFHGVLVEGERVLSARVRGNRVELHSEASGTEARHLAYRAILGDLGEIPATPLSTGGSAPETTLATFYKRITFHGPRLQGIVAIEGIGDDFVRGRVRRGRPRDWIPKAIFERWSIDPLVLDSAMQMAGFVAWERFGRSGTPVSMGGYAQLHPFLEDEITVDVRFDAPEGDRFAANIFFYDKTGRLLAQASDVVAELRKEAARPAELALKPEWTQPALWQPVKEMKLRLEMAEAMGIGNPYFHVHEGTARDTTQVDGRSFIHFSGYNYLGLSGDPRVVEDVKASIDRYGTSVSASRVASGERPFHVDLERELAAAQGADKALLFTAGHAANVSTIGHLMDSHDLVIHDELIHDSVLGGIKLSGAGRRSFRHEDPADLERQLIELRPHYEKVLIVVEGVYSMDGDICDLPAYIEIKRRFGCLLMVDEAHSFGVIGATGQGCREHFQLQGDEVDIWMGTLSKSLASCGGWISGSEALIDYLRYTVGGFVFSAGMTPANGVAGLSSLRLMLEEPNRVSKLQENARFFHAELAKHGLDTGPARGGSAILPVVTGNSIHALKLSKMLADVGVNVQPIVFPAVADDAARLRFFLTCLHTKEQLRHSAALTARLLGEIRAADTSARRPQA